MSNCNSSPLGGCDDDKTLGQLLELLGITETKLSEIISKKRELIIDLKDCGDANNDLLEAIDDKFKEVIADNCCDETIANLQRIIDLLNGLIYGDSCGLDGTLECDVIPVDPELPTTTIYVPTTTEIDDNSGIFHVSNVYQFPCLEHDDHEIELFYEGTFGTGKPMYTDFIGGTLVSGYSYIKKKEIGRASCRERV